MIARDRDAVREPADLEGGEVGVTGLPSDDAVLDSVLEAGGADPDAVRRVTIGFDAVSTLAAGKLDAATAFWNAEGVALRDLGVPTREFRVDDYGAPRYPELILATSAETLRDDPELVDVGGRRDRAPATRDVAADPEAGLAALLDAVPELDPGRPAPPAERARATPTRSSSPGRSTARRSPPGPAGTASTGSSRPRSTSTARSPSSPAAGG